MQLQVYLHVLIVKEVNMGLLLAYKRLLVQAIVLLENILLPVLLLVVIVLQDRLVQMLVAQDVLAYAVMESTLFQVLQFVQTVLEERGVFVVDLGQIILV